MRAQLLPPLSSGRAPCRAGRHLDRSCRLQVHHQKSTERKHVMSKDQKREKSDNGITQSSDGLKRRDLLLSSTSMLAASAMLGAGFATAQAQQPAPPAGQRPNIVVIIGYDIGYWN